MPGAGAVHYIKSGPKATIDTDRERALLLRQRGGLLTPEEQKLVQETPDTQLNRAVDALRGLIIYNRYATIGK